MASHTDGKSFRELETVFEDLSDISRELNRNAKFYVIGHGFDLDENEKDGLCVAVPEGTKGSFKVNKNDAFFKKVAQVPVTKEFIDFYFHNSNMFPSLPKYDGKIIIRVCKNQKTKVIQKQKQIWNFGSIMFSCIIWILGCLALKMVLKNQIHKYPSLNIGINIFSMIFAYICVLTVGPKGNTKKRGKNIAVLFLGTLGLLETLEFNVLQKMAPILNVFSN